MSQLPAVSFYCTLYPVTAEPPSLAGASQDTSSVPVSSGETFRLCGASGIAVSPATAAVASLVSVSRLFLSSLNDTFTLMVLPASSSTRDRLLERLLREQCHVGKHQDGRPRDDDDDAGECKVPVALKDPKQVSADSLQSPHDPDVTYSGHKGKGYEVQVAETCHEENATQLITHVEVTPSSGSDTDVSVPVVDGLAERKVRPDELFADTAYGSGRNAFEASRRGTELVSPVAGSAPGNSHEGEGDGPPPRTFRSTSQGSRPRCAPPATRPSRSTS